MASTRSKNTPGNYALERELYTKHGHYMVTNNAYDTTMNLAGNGLLGQKCPANQLSNNSTDIESLLFGIHSTDLEISSFTAEPSYKSLKTLNIQERTPLIMPEEFVPLAKQRPFPR